MAVTDPEFLTYTVEYKIKPSTQRVEGLIYTAVT